MCHRYHLKRHIDAATHQKYLLIKNSLQGSPEGALCECGFWYKKSKEATHLDDKLHKENLMKKELNITDRYNWMRKLD